MDIRLTGTNCDEAGDYVVPIKCVKSKGPSLQTLQHGRTVLHIYGSFPTSMYIPGRREHLLTTSVSWAPRVAPR